MFIIVPPPVFYQPVIKVNQDIVNNQISKLIPALAKFLGIPDHNIINLFNALKGANEEYFCDNQTCDGVHPTKEGYKIIAKIVYDAIKFY